MSIVELVYAYGTLRYIDYKQKKLTRKRINAWLSLVKGLAFTGLYIALDEPGRLVLIDTKGRISVSWKCRSNKQEEKT